MNNPVLREVDPRGVARSSGSRCSTPPSAEAAEGLASFVEKRPARWAG